MTKIWCLQRFNVELIVSNEMLFRRPKTSKRMSIRIGTQSKQVFLNRLLAQHCGEREKRSSGSLCQRDDIHLGSS